LPDRLPACRKVAHVLLKETMFFEKAKKTKSPPTRRLEDNLTSQETFVSEETRITGSIQGDGGIVISGHVDGDVLAKGIIFLEPEGVIDGQAVAGGVIVAGEMNGNIASGGRVEVRASGRVTGDIECVRIAIEEGGTVKGKIRMPRSSGQPFFFNEKRDNRESPE